jgi:predicted AAA+ superfamily ATPase
VIRHASIPEPEEPATFPIRMLPYRQNPRFYGREAELDKINQALDWKNPNNALLRTYTIYGRRGVGKTELALQYAYTNLAKFDAIFWVGCETSLNLQQSFTNIAIEVKLLGADKHGRRVY